VELIAVDGGSAGSVDDRSGPVIVTVSVVSAVAVA
jgi:hypothetical protein